MVCPYEINFYVLQCLRNRSTMPDEEIFEEVKKKIAVSEAEFKNARKEVEKIIKRYAGVVDPLVKGLIPFYAFINVRDNFRFVTERMKENVGKAGDRLIALYDLIGKPDFILIGLTEGAKGRLAEEYTHMILSEMGGEKIHNYLTTQVEIPRSMKKFWHANFDLVDFEERAKELPIEYDWELIKNVQEDCRKVELESLDKVLKGCSVVIKTEEYPSRQWNFVKAFIQVDALYDKFNDLFSSLEEKYKKDIRGMVEIPYSRYGILVECEVANIAVLGEIMGAIRNQDYVRTTRTAIARDVIKEDLWVI